MKKLGYSDLRDQLMNCPTTWIPALIQILIKEAYLKNVFLKNSASQFVKNIEDNFWTVKEKEEK